MDEAVALILILILIVACLFGGVLMVDNASCDAQTSDMGFPHKWGIMSGCMIEPNEGQWIPLENWRLFEE
jgi:hypothetical protein